MYHPILRHRAQGEIKKIGKADLVIGLPSYKNPKRAAQVAQAALTGAHQHYPDLRTVLVNVDAGLAPNTRRAVRQQQPANGSNCTVVAGRYEGLLGRGSAVAAALDAALAVDAKAIIILDSNTLTMTPNWIPGLAHLVLEDKADLVVPRYHWSALSPLAMLNDLIIYPLFRALWGYSLRYPCAPDVALSPQLATSLLDADVWETEVATSGLAPWMATYATVGRWRVAQSALGNKQSACPGSSCDHKTQKNCHICSEEFKLQFYDLINVMLRQVYQEREHWPKVNKFRSLSTLTQFTADSDQSQVPEQDPTPMLDELAIGWIEHRWLWQSILTPENLTQLETLAALQPEQFYFPADLWGRIIYDFAVVFNKGEQDPYQVVKALFPIYQGRVAAFWQEIAGLSLVGREGTTSAQAVEIEELKAYLKIRWHTYQPWE